MIILMNGIGLYNIVKKEREKMFRVNKLYSKANIQKTIRFTESIYSELNELAKEENMSFNTLVLQCCRYALDNREKSDENGEKGGEDN